MSLFVQIRKEDRRVQGELVKVGDHCWLPNALAMGLEGKGFCAWASGDAQIKEAKRKRERREYAELAAAELADEGKSKKGRRAHG